MATNSKPKADDAKQSPSSPPAVASGGVVAEATPPTPGQEQAALDQEAADLAEKAQREADEAAAAAAEAERAAEKAADYGEPRAARCPVCRGRMERYVGENPHKQGTRFCPTCGQRVAIGG